MLYGGELGGPQLPKILTAGVQLMEDWAEEFCLGPKKRLVKIFHWKKATHVVFFCFMFFVPFLWHCFWEDVGVSNLLDRWVGGFETVKKLLDVNRFEGRMIFLNFG